MAVPSNIWSYLLIALALLGAFLMGRLSITEKEEWIEYSESLDNASLGEEEQSDDSRNVSELIKRDIRKTLEDDPDSSN